MSKVNNPIYDLADLAVKNHSDLDQLAWSTAGHTIDTNVDFAGNQLLNTGTININATADHTIYNSSDNLIIQNSNSNKNLIFSVKEGSNQENFLTLDTSSAQLPSLVLNTANRYALNTDGFFKIAGLMSINAVGVGMSFKPDIQGGQFIAFYNNPTVSGQSTITGMFFGPNYGNFARLANIITLSLTAHLQGQNDNYSFLQESTSRQSFVFSGTDATTSQWAGFKWGAAWTMGDSTGSNTAYTENMIYLTGGASRVLGTGGSITQKGLRFAGFGTQVGLIGGTDSVRAMEANGGLFSHKYDYNGTTNGILMGAGEDWGFGFNGTIMKLEALVGTADFHIDCGTEKTLVLDETVWNDVQFNIETGRVGVANFPDWDTAFTTNTGAYKFAVDDYIDLGTNEIPHGWKEGTTLKPHLHLTLDGANASGGNQYVKFTVYIAYSDVNEIWTETSVTAEYTIPTGTADMTHLLLSLGDLAFTNQLIGTQMNIRIKRIAATGGTEYPNHIFVTQFGIHYETDTIGSRTVASK